MAIPTLRLDMRRAPFADTTHAEIYAVAENEDAIDAVAAFFSDYHQVQLDDLREHLYVRKGSEATRHLFRRRSLPRTLRRGFGIRRRAGFTLRRLTR